MKESKTNFYITYRDQSNWAPQCNDTNQDQWTHCILIINFVPLYATNIRQFKSERQKKLQLKIHTKETKDSYGFLKSLDNLWHLGWGSFGRCLSSGHCHNISSNLAIWKAIITKTSSGTILNLTLKVIYLQ